MFESKFITNAIYRSCGNTLDHRRVLKAAELTGVGTAGAALLGAPEVFTQGDSVRAGAARIVRMRTDVHLHATRTLSNAKLFSASIVNDQLTQSIIGVPIDRILASPGTKQWVRTS